MMKTAGRGREVRIDELAREAGTTVRNVRAYQDRGLLPPPRRDGRVGMYGQAHLARLRLIGRLLDRGYTLANIAELIGAFERGEHVEDLLGLREALTRGWSDESPVHLTAAQLAELFGGKVTACAVKAATKLGLLESEGDGFRVPSPRVLHAGAELVAAGIPLEATLDVARLLRRDIDRISSLFVALVTTHLVDPYEGEIPPPRELARLAGVIRRLRPLAETVVDAELARSMERSVAAGLGRFLERLQRTDETHTEAS